MPLRIFKTPNLLASNIVMALLGAAWIPMWFFLNLYLQQVQGYGAFESGLALLPMTAAIMVLMIGASSRVISRLGVKRSLVAGLGLLTLAILMFVATPYTKGSFATHVLPASLVAAGGMSLAYIPALMSAVSHARKGDSGLASGIVNTSYQIGSALGLAIMVAIASAQTIIDENSGGIRSIEALNNGFHLAFMTAAIVAAIAAIVAFLVIKKPNTSGGMEKDVVVAPTG
jgi:predicted MFS family arabinose efflux permease